MSSLLFLRLTLYGYSLLVFAVSVMPVAGPQVVTNQDKIIHFFMYFVMASLAILVRKYASRKQVLSLAFFYAAGFGILMEMIQYFLPYRSFEVMDILANSAGAVFAIILASIMRYA